MARDVFMVKAVRNGVEKTAGPFEFKMLQDLMAQGVYHEDDYLSSDGALWFPARQFPRLFRFDDEHGELLPDSETREETATGIRSVWNATSVGTVVLAVLLPIGLFAVVWPLILSGNKTAAYGPGIVAPDAPEQTNTQAKPIVEQDYTITPVADFALTARVLSVQRYRSGVNKEGDLSPVDLALGWGQMSDAKVLRDIRITQGNRFYYWRSSSMPIPRREIETGSANMHIIPANEIVARKLKNVQTGHVVGFRGHLVNVMHIDGWRWKSSLSRRDSGKGACELVYVTAFEIIPAESHKKTAGTTAAP